jgi:hypothetical protein
MGGIIFKSIDKEVIVAERGVMARFCENLGIKTIMDKVNYDNLEETSKIIKFKEDDSFVEEYFNKDEPGIALRRNMDLDLKLRWDDDIKIYDEVLKEWSTPWLYFLNFAMRVGNPLIHIMARLHGQCEIHAYIKKNNFSWFKDIIQEGLDKKILRDKIRVGKKEYSTGWTELIEMLETTEGNEIVTSFTVCEEFPMIYLGLDDEESKLDMEWDVLWGLAWEHISKDGLLEICPEQLNDFYFSI